MRVNEEYRDLLRFFWWEDDDFIKESKEYRMIVYLFGVILFFGCVNFVLKVTVNDFKREFGIIVVDFF